MKKLLLSMMAVAAMVSCVKDQVVVTKEQRVVAWQSYDGSSFTDLIKFAAEYHEDN